MTTKFVGLKEFRQHMAKFSKEAEKKKHRLVILRKNRPIFEIHPISPRQQFIDDLHRRAEQGKEDLRRGRTYSTKEIRKSLGLD